MFSLRGRYALPLGLEWMPRNIKLPVQGAFLTPVVTYNQIPNVAMHMNLPTQDLPATYSLFALVDNGLTLSTVKFAERRNAVIIRVYNQTAKKCPLEVTGMQVKQILNLNEDPVDLGLTVKPNSVRTVEVEN